MFGAFASAKVKAFQLTKQEFAEGGYEQIKGGTHASGNDTYLGFQTSSGKAAYAERGESHAVFTGSANKKYGKLIPQIVESMNKQTYEHFFANASGSHENVSLVQQSTDMSVTENELTRIRKQGERKVSSAGGKTVETYKSVTRYYR